MLLLQNKEQNMKIFIDSANLEEIKELNETGLIDGVTTNPSLVAKSDLDFSKLLQQICNIVEGPVSAEVIATDSIGMINEGKKLAAIAPNIVVKLPLTWDGLIACNKLAHQDIMVNVTLCFTANQALLAAKAGASFISPFIGRLEDVGHNGIGLIDEICSIYHQYDFDTQVLAASIRSPEHVTAAALAGADVCTMPAKVIKQLALHPLTDKGLEIFLNDWKKSNKTMSC